MSQTILIVDEDPDCVRFLGNHLREEGYEVLSATRGTDALRMACDHRPDLILLELLLPEVDGTEVCQILKAQPETENIPFIILTTRSSRHDRIIGFELGCDDYVIKPFHIRELILRIRAVLRRYATPSTPSEVLRVAGIEVDVARHRVTVGTEVVDLTPTEFNLLVYLIRRKKHVQSRRILLNRVWGVFSSKVDTRTVDTHITRIRKKLGPLGKIIRTVPKVGYVFDPPDENAAEAERSKLPARGTTGDPS